MIFTCKFEIGSELDGRSVYVEFVGKVHADDHHAVKPIAMTWGDVENAVSEPWVNRPYHELEEEALEELKHRYREHCQDAYECQEWNDDR